MDCTGTAHATLFLADYTPGSALQISNFLGLEYSSDFLPSFSLTPQDVVLITGTLPASQGPGEVFINAQSGVFFSHVTQGFWCVGIQCAADAGINGVWTTVPEPGAYSFALLGGVLCYVLGVRRRIAISGGTRKRTGSPLVPTPVVTNMWRPRSTISPLL